jgi:hypothetical protein
LDGIWSRCAQASPDYAGRSSPPTPRFLSRPGVLTPCSRAT